MPAGHVHFAAERCVDCRRLLRWLPRPGTIERRKLNGFRLAKLSMCDKLSDWERDFVRSVGEKKHLSPKQLEIVERLCRRYLEGAP